MVPKHNLREADLSATYVVRHAPPCGYNHFVVNKREIWIGLAEAVTLPGATRCSGAKGAAVSVLGWATSADVFCARVARMLREDHQLQLLEMHDPEPFSAYIEKWESTDEILTIVDELKTAPNAVRPATFHWWVKND